MSESIISVRNLTKTYKLYNNPADRVKEVFHPFRKQYFHPFNALSDISFDVLKGETLGIIGRNGSGKSTLLQIICGILQPTAGNVMVNGRISALLELGAGFNPEFTGRENVYINGAILGLSRQEMDDRFGDIAAFADIGDFIEQPVKTYSSGMYVRLAFAVAINVDPDILIVDEALAVGDEIFQRKCFARIQKIQKSGGTILFVSHAAQAILELCNKVIFLDQGELLLSGKPKYVVSIYQKFIFASPDKITALREEIQKSNFKKIELKIGQNRKKIKEIHALNSYYDPSLITKSTINYESKGAYIDNVKITTLGGESVNILIRGQRYCYSYMVSFHTASYNIQFGMLIKTISGLELGGTSLMIDDVFCVETGTKILVEFEFKCLLNPGVYFFNAGVSGDINNSKTYLHRLIDAAMFRVQAKENFFITGMIDFCITPTASIINNSLNH